MNNYFVLFVEDESNLFTYEIGNANIVVIEKAFNEMSKSCYISMYNTEQSFKDGRDGIILKSKNVQ